jgi:hypothetical protein
MQTSHLLPYRTPKLGSLWGQTGPCTLTAAQTVLSPGTHQSPPWCFGSLSDITLHLTPVFLLDQQTPVLVSYWFARWSCESPAVSFCPTASQWELRSTVPFPPYFLHNREFPASPLLGLPPAFTLVSCSAYYTLKMETICSSETSVDFQRATRRYLN